MSYREIDDKRDQFRKYIESKGVIDGITKVLIKLLETPEKPEHPMDFIRANLGATQADEKRIASLEKEVDDYKKEVSELKTQLDAVKVKLGEYEKQTDTVKEATVAKKDENLSVPVQSTEAKGTETNQISSVGSVSNGDGGSEGADADVIKDKSVAASEKAATPNTNAATVDNAKVSNESENADTGKSSSTAATNNDGSKSATASVDTAVNDGEKAESVSGISDKAVPANLTDKDK